MNSITKKLLLLIGPIILENIFNSIFNEEKLSSFRDNIVTLLRKTADKSLNDVDDYLLEISIDTIMTPGKYIEHTRELCAILKSYIQSSQTKWDDIAFLPILERIEELGTTPE